MGRTVMRWFRKPMSVRTKGFNSSILRRLDILLLDDFHRLDFYGINWGGTFSARKGGSGGDFVDDIKTRGDTAKSNVVWG